MFSKVVLKGIALLWILFILYVSTLHVSIAACVGALPTTRASISTSWTFKCNVPGDFQTKAREAISKWNYADDYIYTESTPCPPYAYSWGYSSFATQGWGTSPGRTFVTYNYDEITAASSYYNSDKTWFNSTTDNQNWPAGQYDRLTVALHEVGHWMVLYHPSDCGQNVLDAVMEPLNKTKMNLRTDDHDGLYQLGIHS